MKCWTSLRKSSEHNLRHRAPFVNSNRADILDGVIRSLLLSSLVVSSFLVVACGGPEVRHPYKADDNTPANSTSESRLAGEDPSRPKSTTQTSASDSSATSAAADPTQPEVNKVGDMPKESGGSSASGSGTSGKSSDKNAAADSGGGKGTKPSKTGPKISKAECDKAFEKAIELEIGSNPQFAGLDKAELVSMTKSMAKQQHGDAPCDATRSQYTCAMAATSTAQWKKCMQ